MKIATVIGARPQFVKSAIVSEALQGHPGVVERIIHTGQHYDARMSRVFFTELGIPEPAHHLHVGSGSHGEQTGAMLAALEEVFLAEAPDVVLVYGDTNSTLAGALAAVKQHIPVAHVEAGMRSFNRRMPEEINRVMTDHVASLHLCATPAAVEHLAREGVTDGVHLVGDVMYDCALRYAEVAQAHVDPLGAYGLVEDGYALLTCHRADNTDDPGRLAAILRGVNAVAEMLPVVFPVHPRTRGKLDAAGVALHDAVRLLEPVSYLEMLLLEQHARLILTDSGGVQKEAFFYRVPCVTLREETEWVETVEVGANRLAGADEARIIAAARAALRADATLPDPGPYYGNGQAARRIAWLLAESQLVV